VPDGSPTREPRPRIPAALFLIQGGGGSGPKTVVYIYRLKFLMRPTALGGRELGSKSKIRRHRLLRGRLMGRFERRFTCGPRVPASAVVVVGRRVDRCNGALACRQASETPSSSARRITLPGLVRSIVASFSIPMRLIGCSKISASSDGVKFFLCMVIATSMCHLKNAQCGKEFRAALLSKRTLLPGYLT